MNEYKITDATGGSMAVESRGYAVDTITADKTFTIADSGKVFAIATDALTLTLPAITANNVGMSITVVNTGADGNNIVTISPAATDSVSGTIANSAADSVAGGVVDKDIINTKATANKGDRITLTAVALTEWYITDGVGIWASEA